jgi:Zn-dependent protease
VVKLPVAEWSSLFAVYRVLSIRGDEVVQGILHQGLEADQPEVRAILDDWKGMHFLHHTPGRTELTLVRRRLEAPRERWWLHLVLALLTLLTTTLAGAYFAGGSPLRLALAGFGPLRMPLPVHLVASEMVPGLIFSVPLCLILLVHELGHYVTARRYGMNVSPPYFIPAPPGINVVGTFGAFIRLRSPMINRVMLLDVGAGGPLASFLLSIPVVLLGMAWSRPVPRGVATQTGYVAIFDGQPIWLGGSVLFDALAAATGPGGGGAVVLHPLAFAGWLGLFVTAMNLFPLAQLDGGHILHALIGERQRWAGLAFLALLIVLGREWWGWWIWAGLILLLGRGTIGHPPVLDEEYPIGRGRSLLGWACVLIFLLTFVAVPIRL